MCGARVCVSAYTAIRVCVRVSVVCGVCISPYYARETEREEEQA